MRYIVRKILSLVCLLGLGILPYSCLSLRPKNDGLSKEIIYEDYDEFGIDDNLPENDFEDEVANDEGSFVETVEFQPMVKISDNLGEVESIDRLPASITFGEGKVNFYQTKPFDTLMLISHDLYGDYRRWREILAINQDVVSKDYKIIGLPKIKFIGDPIQWPIPSGRPYFIKSGDTLGIISRKVYGNKTFWREISDHNPNLIKDPNLIFAGFYLYYPSISNYSMIH